MRVFITGGFGVLGRLLAPRHLAAGHEVVLSSRRERLAPAGTTAVKLDLGETPVSVKSFEGVDVVVHAASNPARTGKVDVAGTAALLDACKAADVRHFLYPSIVGIDEHPFPYYRAKVAAEQAIAESGQPHSMLRTTQFHEFLDRIFSTGPAIVAFKGVEFQVIDGAFVADRLVDLATGPPAGRVDDLGGPASESMVEMARSWKEALPSRKPLLRVPVFGKSAAAFKAKVHHTANRAEGTRGWAEWLRDTYGP